MQQLSNRLDLEPFLDRPLAVSPDTPLAEAIALLAQKDDQAEPASAIVVVAERQFVGLLTQRNALQLAITKNVQELTVADGMQHCVTVKAADALDITTVQRLFEQHHLEQLPILGEDNIVLGLVTLASLNRVLSAEHQHRQGILASYHRQAQLLDVVEQAVIATDLKGHITYWNRCAEALYGWKAEEVRGQQILEVVPAPAMREAATAILSRLQTGTSWSNEVTLQRRDGTTFPAVVIVAPLYDQQNQIVGMVGVSKDVSDRQQAKQQLQASEARFQAFMEHSPAIAFIFDGFGRIVYANSLLAEVLQTETAELLRQTNPDVLPEELARRHRANDRQVLATGQPIKFIESCLDRHGNLQNWLVCKFPLTSPAGEPLVGGVGIDITERQRSETALRESEARFQEIARTIRQFFFVRSAVTGQFVYVSPAYETIWGRTCESLYRNPDSWQEAIHPEDRQRVLTSLAEQTSGHQVTREYRIIQPNGDRRWIFAQINPITDEAGNVVRWIGIAEDITERKQAEEALRQNQLRFQQLSSSVPALLYSVVQRAEGTLQFEYVSSEVQTIYEIEPERALQNATLVYQQILPADREVFFERVRQTTQTLTPFRHEWRIMTPSGQHKWVQATAQTERRSDGSMAWHGVMLDISDRKQTEEKLEQSRATLRSFFDSSPLMMGVVELLEHDIRHITDNAAAAALFSLTPQQMHHRLASKLGMPPQHIELWLLKYRASRQTGEPVQFEYVHRAESERWLSVTVAPIANLVPDRFAYVAEDITPRKQGEIELQQTYQRLQFHLENTPLAVIEWDPEFHVQRWSPQAEAIFGWQAEEVMGKHWSDWRFVSEADLETVTVSAQRLLNGYDSRNFSCNRNYTRSGAIVYCEWYNSVLLDDHGQVVSILSLVQNATVRNQAEIRLQEREHFLRSIYNGVEQAIFVVDVTPARNFRYADLNPAAAQAIAKSAVEVADQTFEEVFEPELAALARERFTSCLRLGTTIVREDYLNLAGGTWWLHTLTPLRDEQGEIYRIIETASNITERKRIEQERDRLLQRVEQHNQILETCVQERTAELERTNEQLEQEISDRQQIETVLRESEERYRLIFNQAAAGIAQTTIDGRYVQVNQKLAEILGYSPEELCQNLTILKLTHPDDRAVSYEYMRRIVAGELESYSLEKRYICKDGSPIWVQIFITLLRDSIGNPLYFIKVINDISERKQAEQALSLSERKFRGAFDTIAVGMAIVAITGGFVEVNGELCQMLGYSETELLKLSFAEITYSEDLSKDLHLFEQLMQGEIPSYQLEKRYLHKNGQLVWGWLSVSLIRSTGQSLFLIAQIQDITERKRSEAALHQKLEQERLIMAIAQHIRTSLDLDEILSTAVEEVRQLLHAERVSVFRVTSDGFGRVVAEAVIPGQPTILGMEFPDEQFPLEYYDLYSDGHARIVPNVATDAIAHCIAEFLVELGVRSKLSVPIIQGQTLWGVMTVHHCSATERCWQSWELELIEGLALQLAIAIQQSELYQQLQSELRQKERSLHEKSVLLKEVHHRVKNNLQVISSLLWMQSQQIRDEQALRLSKDAQSRVQTIALIHEQLYRTEDLAQIDFGQYVQTLANKLFRSYGNDPQAIGLKVEVEAEPLTIETAIPCGLIVNELISNSLKYAFPDHRAGEICIRLHCDVQKDFVLSVSDNGIGLPQPSPSKSLGLLIVDDLVEQLNGRIELNSDDGTCFRIIFPNAH